MELVKESIQYEQLLGESTVDTVIRSEFVIPDTHPDVSEILMIDSKPLIVSKEVIQDKVYLEGQIESNVLYLANVEGKNEVFSVTYTKGFKNYLEVPGATHEMRCEAYSYVEHMECGIANERKITVEGIIQLKGEVYKNYRFDIVKDLEDYQDIQLLKNPVSVDKILGTVNGDMIAKSHMQVEMSKPQIQNILKCDANVHKKTVKLMDGKAQVDAFVHFKVLYKAKDSRDLFCLEDDVFVTKEFPIEGANSFMNAFGVLEVEGVEFDVREDDLGENRIADIEALIKCNVKVMNKTDVDMIEDAYSPTVMLEMEKKDFELNVNHGNTTVEAITKDNLDVNPAYGRPTEMIMNTGKASITDKKLVEDKVLIEGVLNVKALYRTDNEDNYVGMVDEEIPFTATVDIPGAKIDMQGNAKVTLESLDTAVEGNTIGVKAVVSVDVRVDYKTHKEFLVGMKPLEGEVPSKKASVTIYVVQTGDTLWKIAKKYFTTIEDLVKVNELENSNVLKVGEKLIIPGNAAI